MLLGGGTIISFQASLTLRNAPSDCHPFDAYPGFKYKTGFRLWENEPKLADGDANWGWYSSLTRTRRVLVTYRNGTTVEKPILQVVCDIEHHKPCILSGDLYLNNRNHRDPYLAWRQGTFWPFISAKAAPVPNRDAFWRLVALLLASPRFLHDRQNIVYISFLVNGNARLNMDKKYEDIIMEKLKCEVVVRAIGRNRVGVNPPEPCDKGTVYEALDANFDAGQMCDNPPGVLNPVREQICSEWHDYGILLSDHHRMAS